MLYFVNANDTVVAMEAKTGKLRWTQHRTPALGIEVAGYAGPLVTSDRVYAAFSDGHVAAYDPIDGTERWPLVDLSAEVEQAQGEAPRYFDVDTTPVLDTLTVGRVVYVASYAGGVFALDAETGSRVWVNDRALGVTELVLWQQPAHAPRDGVGPAIPGRKLLLASSGTTGLWALGSEDGHEVWRRPLPDGGVSAPVPIAGALLVSTTRYGLFLFSPLDGGVIDGLDLSNGVAMAPSGPRPSRVRVVERRRPPRPPRRSPRRHLTPAVMHDARGAASNTGSDARRPGGIEHRTARRRPGGI